MRRSLSVLAVLALLGACSAEQKQAPVPPTPVGGTSRGGTDAAPGQSPAREDGASAAPAGGNRAPEIRHVWFVGGDGTPGNTVGIESETFDPDGDPVHVEISWTKNGEPAGNGKLLPVPAKRGDRILVTVTPSDGKEAGRPATLLREIRNTPPGIDGHDQFRIDNNIAGFRVRASDVDGDPVTYSLKEAPAGMTIDRNSGVVRWEIAAGTVGKIPFIVVVSDGQGAETTARISVTIAEQPPVPSR